MAPSEKYNRLNYAFDPNAPSPIGAMVAANIAKGLPGGAIPAQYASLYAGLSNIKGSMGFAGVNGNPGRAAYTDLSAIQPRVGFAYRVKDRLVVRGGFGQFMVNPTNDWLQTYGFSNNTSLVNSNDGGRTPILDAMQNPFPTGINRPTGSSLGALTYAGKSFNWFNPNFILPRSSQFSAGIQYGVSRSATLDVSYVGNRVAHEQTNAPFDINPNYLSCSVMYGATGSRRLRFSGRLLQLRRCRIRSRAWRRSSAPACTLPAQSR